MNDNLHAISILTDQLRRMRSAREQTASDIASTERDLEDRKSNLRRSDEAIRSVEETLTQLKAS